jgi:hypothetical protein
MLVLVAICFVGYERRVHRPPVQLTSVVEPKPSPSPVQTPHAGPAPDWVRQTVDELDAGTPFIIVSMTSSFGQLSAGAIYRWVDKKGPVILNGRKGSYGDFWPAVSYEVGIEVGKKWKVIAGNQPELPVTITFDAENPKGRLTVDMEPFRSSIGKFRRGRVVLSNGEAAEIMLDDLLPTPESRVASGNYRKYVTDPHQTRFGSLFALVSITAFSNHLFGDFVFVGREGTFVELKGTKSADGEFWPIVGFQCGNGDDNWQTVGRSDNNHAKETMLRLSAREALRPVRVPLDVYQAYRKRFKYGRLVFTDTEVAAVFQMSDLEP